MNKDFLNSLPADEQPVASQLNSLIDELPISQSFQGELETKLMDAAKNKKEPAAGWGSRLIPALAWTFAAIGSVLILNWTIRSISSPAPAAGVTPAPLPSFEEKVRQGKVCAGPLALGHEFGVFLTNEDKTGFLPFDQENTIGEMRSFAWRTNGSQLAIFGNTTGHGNVWLTDSTHNPARPVISNSELGYIMDGAWSWGGKQFVLWSSQNNTFIDLVQADGTGLEKKQLDIQILGTPQFAPDGKSIILYGANQNQAGLFQMDLDRSKLTLLSPLVKDSDSYAYSPDGSHLAYMEYDRDAGESRLVTIDLAIGAQAILGKFEIPSKSGASLPESANLSWSADGKFLVFDYGQYASDRAIYLAPTDGTGFVKVIDDGYAPSISPDGKCLAYINEGQVFLLDLHSTSSPAVPLLLAELPAGRGAPNNKQDKLQWKP
jgi:dipeptidyl aminopeptidase/acylaminoacyl peptidase